MRSLLGFKVPFERVGLNYPPLVIPKSYLLDSKQQDQGKEQNYDRKR